MFLRKQPLSQKIGVSPTLLCYVRGSRHMSELKALIHRATEDLLNIQNTLNEAAQPDTAGEYREHIMEELANVNMDELKAAVDHMRHVLWSYVEVSAGEGTNVAQALQDIRMQRTTEMLRMLSPRVQDATQVRTPETATIFELIHQIADSAVDTHGKHAAAEN